MILTLWGDAVSALSEEQIEVISNRWAGTTAPNVENVPEQARRDVKALILTLASARARIRSLEEQIGQVQRLAASQAEDEALWAISGSIVEAYTQQELRRLTAAVESIRLSAPPGEGAER